MVELMVVVLIMAVLGLSIVPSLIGSADTDKTRSGTHPDALSCMGASWVGQRYTDGRTLRILRNVGSHGRTVFSIARHGTGDKDAIVDNVKQE